MNGFPAPWQHHWGSVVVRRKGILCLPSGLRETGLREGVVVAGVGVAGEGEAWGAGTPSTLAANASSTDTAAATNREWTE